MIANDLSAAAGARREHAVIAHDVEPGRRHERYQFFHQLELFEGHVRRSVAPAVLELVLQRSRPSSRRESRCVATGGRAT